MSVNQPNIEELQNELKKHNNSDKLCELYKQFATFAGQSDKGAVVLGLEEVVKGLTEAVNGMDSRFSNMFDKFQELNLHADKVYKFSPEGKIVPTSLVKSFLEYIKKLYAVNETIASVQKNFEKFIAKTEATVSKLNEFCD